MLILLEKIGMARKRLKYQKGSCTGHDVGCDVGCYIVCYYHHLWELREKLSAGPTCQCNNWGHELVSFTVSITTICMCIYFVPTCVLGLVELLQSFVVELKEQLAYKTS